LRRVLLERDRQRLAGSHRPCLGLRDPAPKCRRRTARSGLHRRLRFQGKRSERRSQRRRRSFRNHPPASHARRRHHRHLYSAGSAQTSVRADEVRLVPGQQSHRVPPAEAGTLIDDTIHPRDITSTIVDLAVRGYIKIEEKVDTFLVFHHKDYLFHLLKPREQWGPDLTPHERVMLENIFLGGAETRLSSLKNRFYTVIPVVRQDIMSELKSKGIYTLDPE